MRIRAYIVDDELLARDRIRALLEKHPDVDVCGESNDGNSAVAAIRVFLDVQMPGLDGFDVLRNLTGAAATPIIIFVTAYDRYAVEAFTALQW